MRETEIKNAQNAILRELGEGAVSMTKDIKREIDTTLRDIAEYHQWSWLENVPLSLSTDEKQNYITIPDYLGKEITIHQADSGKEIRYKNPQQYARMLAASDNPSDKPEWFTVRGGRIEFYYPLTTGGSVTVFGTIDPGQLKDNDSPAIDGVRKIMPDHFANILEWGALRKLDSDNQKKAEWADFYFNELRIKRNTDGVSKGRTFTGQRDRAILSSRGFLRG